MGCVFSTTATRDSGRCIPRRPSGSNQNRRSVEKLGESSRDGVVKVKKDGEKNPAPDRLKQKPAFGLKTSQGWPEWLCEVAGDAVKDWTPRRANSFEKLDKVFS